MESAFERGLDVASSRASYEAQIERMARDYDVIDLDALLSGRLPRRPLVLTFDDVFRSVLDVAREVLAPRGLPAVFFINPGLLGRDAVSFDGALAWAAQTAGLDALCRLLGTGPQPDVGALIRRLASRSAGERAELKARLFTALGPPDLTDRAPILEEEDLKTLRTLGVEVGNHTMTHVSCRALRPDELEHEVVAAKTRLEAMSGAPVRAFSVPYGNEQDLTPEILKVLRASGHEAIFLVHARSNAYRPAADIWYRVGLKDETPAELPTKLRYAPALRSIKQRLLG